MRESVRRCVNAWHSRAMRETWKVCTTIATTYAGCTLRVVLDKDGSSKGTVTTNWNSVSLYYNVICATMWGVEISCGSPILIKRRMMGLLLYRLLCMLGFIQGTTRLCLENVGECFFSRPSVSFSPHELVQIPWQHALVAPLHSFKLGLRPVPIWLNVVGVYSSLPVNKFDRMVDCTVAWDVW